MAGTKGANNEARMKPWTRRFMEVLADGREHDWDEALFEAMAAVPPGMAFRKAEDERARGWKARYGDDAEIPPRRRGDMNSTIAAGARSIVLDNLLGLRKRGRIVVTEHDGRKTVRLAEGAKTAPKPEPKPEPEPKPKPAPKTAPPLRPKVLIEPLRPTGAPVPVFAQEPETVDVRAIIKARQKQRELQKKEQAKPAPPRPKQGPVIQSIPPRNPVFWKWDCDMCGVSGILGEGEDVQGALAEHVKDRHLAAYMAVRLTVLNEQDRQRLLDNEQRQA